MIPRRALAFAAAAALLVLGGWLRFYELDRQSFWQDEIHTALYVIDDPSPAVVVERVAAWDLHSPLFYLLLRAETAIVHGLGQPLSDRNLRLLPALLGTLALPAVFLLGWRIFGNPWPGILMMLLAGVNVYGVYYSQELRMYSLIHLLAPLFLFFSLSLWTSSGARLRTGMAAGFVVTGLGLLYSSLVCLFLVAAVGAALLLITWLERKNDPNRWRDVVILSVVIVAGYAPWIPVMWQQSQLLKAGVWTGFKIVNPLELLYYVERSMFFHFFRLRDVPRLAWLLVALIPLAGLVFIEKPRRREHGMMFLTFAFLFLGYFIATWNKPFHLGRYFAPWWPHALYFTAAGYIGLMALFRMVRPQMIWTGAALLAMFVFVYANSQQRLLAYYFTDYQKENWRAAALGLHAFSRPGDVLLVTGGWHEGCLRYYGAALPWITVADWQQGRLPGGAQRLVYVGGREPKLDIKNLKEKFRTWPLKNCNMQFYTLELKGRPAGSPHQRH